MRRELWDLDCLTKDLVIALSFEAWELTELLEFEGHEIDGDPAHRLSISCVAHRLSACAGAFARRPRRRLDNPHAIAVGMIRRTRPDKIGELCHRTADIAGLLCAVSADARPGRRFRYPEPSLQ
jgi:hypothetical protein